MCLQYKVVRSQTMVSVQWNLCMHRHWVIGVHEDLVKTCHKHAYVNPYMVIWRRIRLWWCVRIYFRKFQLSKIIRQVITVTYKTVFNIFSVCHFIFENEVLDNLCATIHTQIYIFYLWYPYFKPGIDMMQIVPLQIGIHIFYFLLICIHTECHFFICTKVTHGDRIKNTAK